MKAKDVVVSSSWVSFRHKPWCILNTILNANHTFFDGKYPVYASITQIIIAAIRNYLRAEKIEAFELLESREDQIQFLLDNQAQIALLQVNHNVTMNNGKHCKIKLCW